MTHPLLHSCRLALTALQQDTHYICPHCEFGSTPDATLALLTLLASLLDQCEAGLLSDAEYKRLDDIYEEGLYWDSENRTAGRTRQPAEIARHTSALRNLALVAAALGVQLAEEVH